MKTLHFDYYMKIEYSIEVCRCNFTIKCIPENTARQAIDNITIEMCPPTEYNWGRDGLNNRQIYGLNEAPHKSFYFRISGRARTGLCEYEEKENDNLTMLFRHPYGLNSAGRCINEYYQKIVEDKNVLRFVEEINNLSFARKVMNQIHADFKYVPNSTNVNTTAEEAFSQGYGVCQDYAHIMIAVLHKANIPARYVTGLIVGEGASHAWVEVWHDGKWYGLDPTNNKVVSDEHIKIGVGRDAHDCMINRGIMHGGGNHTQTINVCVREIGVEI